MENILFNISVTEKNLMQAEFIFIIIAIIFIIASIIVSWFLVYRYNKLLHDMSEKMDTNKSILEGAANNILANSAKIDDQWTRMKRDMQNTHEETKALYKHLNSVATAFKAARDETIRRNKDSE